VNINISANNGSETLLKQQCDFPAPAGFYANVLELSHLSHITTSSGE